MVSDFVYPLTLETFVKEPHIDFDHCNVDLMWISQCSPVVNVLYGFRTEIKLTLKMAYDLTCQVHDLCSIAHFYRKLAKSMLVVQTACF